MTMQTSIEQTLQPAQHCRLIVKLDGDTKNVADFQGISHIDVTKVELLKHGAMIDEPPDYIRESDFEYYQSTFPDFENYHSKFLDIDSTRVISRAVEGSKKRISDIIGVGCGLVYATRLLQVDARAVSHIREPKTKQKFMDCEIAPIWWTPKRGSILPGGPSWQNPGSIQKNSNAKPFG